MIRMPVKAASAIVASMFMAGCGLLAGCTAQNPVATFQVVDQTFKIELATPELVEHAHQLLDGEDVAGIPNGLIVRDDPGVNAPWSWHIDPDSLEFADVTTEVCDGLPEYVEDGTVTSPYYCPWSAEIVSID
ncbi:MAG: hypothetical protein AB7K08_05405 [Microbacteriaceae bacterium]